MGWVGSILAKEYPGNRDSAKKVATFDGPAASIVGTKLLLLLVLLLLLPLAIEVDLLALYFSFSTFFQPPLLLHSSTAKLFSLPGAARTCTCSSNSPGTSHLIECKAGEAVRGFNFGQLELIQNFLCSLSA